MKNFKLFEKLWEHSRTLRRVGLVLVMCLTLGVTHAWASSSVTYTLGNGAAVASVSTSDVVLTENISSKSGSNGWTLGNTQHITISAASGYKITALSATFSRRGDDKFTFTVTGSTTSALSSGTSASWSGDATQLVFTGITTSSPDRLTEIVVTYESGSSYRKFKSGERIYFKDDDIIGGACMKYSGNKLWAVFNGTSSWVEAQKESGSWDSEGAIYYFDVPGSGQEYDFVIFTRNDWGVQSSDAYANLGYNMFVLNYYDNKKTVSGYWDRYVSGSAVLGDFNNWDPDKGKVVDGRVIIDLAASTSYGFKVLMGDGTALTNWYGLNSGSITNTNVPWWTLKAKEDNCTVTSAESGEYCFHWNSSTKAIGIYYPQARLTANEYIYFDARNNSTWKADNFDARFYFKYYDSDDNHSYKDCSKANAQDSWVYYTTVPDNVYIGHVQMNKYVGGSYSAAADDLFARDRSSSDQNCILLNSSNNSVSWSTYCPPMSSATLSDNSTAKVSWQTGTGTSGAPYLVAASGTIKVSALATSAVPDENMEAKYDFKVNDNNGGASSAQSSTSNTYDKTSLTTGHTYEISLDAWNNYNSTDGTKNTSATHLWYKAVTLRDVEHTLSHVTCTGGRAAGTGQAADGEAFSTTFTADPGYNLPSDVTVKFGDTKKTKNTDYTWNSSTGVLTINAASYGATIKITVTGEAKTTTITLDPNTSAHGTSGDGSATATYDSGTLTSVSHTTPEAGYHCVGYFTSSDEKIITAEGALVKNTTYTTNEETPKWKSELSSLTLYAHYAINTYTVTFVSNNDDYGTVNVSEITGVTHGSKVDIDDNVLTLKETDVTATKTTDGADYTYAFTGWSVENGDKITEATTITASFTRTANQYSVTHTLSNVTTSSGSTGANAAMYGTNYTAVFAASSGYALPNSVTVTAGGSDITASCTYTKANGTVLVPGASITGNIVITVTGVATFDFRMVATTSGSDATLTHNESISASSKNCATLTGGSAKYLDEDKSDKQTMTVKSGESYGWNFNRNKDQIVITLSGHVLQEGSVITVSGYANADKAGFKMNGVTIFSKTSGSGSFADQSYTVLSTDVALIDKNVLTLTRNSGSGAYLHSISISNCATGTPCVTPVLPSLTTPNQGCTTGDFAEWDASVTNSSAISAASGSQAVSYSWKNSSSVEVGTYATFTPTAAGTYTVTATVHSETSGYIDATATSSTLTASLYGNPSVTGPSDANYVVGASASNLSVTATPTHGESLTYQWYSNTAKSTSSPTPTALANCTTSTYKPSTAAAGTTYYFCKVSGGCEDVYSSIATVTVTEAPCFKFKAGTTKASSAPKFPVAVDGNITTNLWSAGDPVLNGGSITNTSSSSKTIDANASYGLVFDDNDKEITVTLSGDNVLAKDAVITLSCYSLNDDSKSYGFKINGNNMSPATYTPTADSYETFTQSYTIPTASALIGTKSFKIKRYNSNKVYLNGITVTGCDECEGITPSLSYSKTTLWVNDGDTSTPTLDKDESTGSVTYSSSNTDVATVNESTGVVTAVAGGNVTITASIAADGTHCANTATCNLTIKQATCGEVVIAGVTLSAKDAGTPEGTLIASSSGYVVSTQKWEEPKGGCGTGGKLGESGNYICLTLKSGESFKNGDKVILDIATVPDIGDGKLHIYAGTSSAGTQLGMNASPVCGENEIILSGISSSTPSITLYRTGGDDKQNPYVVSMKVKRFICTDCLGFVDATENGNWNTAGNWIGSTGVSASVPTISDRVHIYKPVTVDINNAKASSVYIYTNSTNTGKVTIDAGKALIIAGKLAKSSDGTNYTNTAAADVIINSTRAAGVGALIIGGETGTNKATVNFATKAKNDGGWVNQFIGSPFSDNEPYVDYALQLYKFVPRANGDRGWWSTVHEGDEMEEFWGYNVLYNDASELDVTWTGTLNASESKTISGLYYNGSSETDNMFANSWTAPIHVGAIEDADLPNASKTLYMFNAGTPAQEEGHDGSNAANNNSDPGTYISIPIHSATYAGIGVIPSMQAFYVEATSSDASITLDYNKIVYTPALTSVGIVPNRAPKHNAEVVEPEVIKLHVQSETGWGANTYVLGRADFAEGYEDGWDGAYIEGESATPKLYTPSIDGNMFINCLPEIEGTVVGFRKGSSDNNYIFSFDYDGDEVWYLNDQKAQKSTQIMNGQTYAFVSEAGDNAARFVISATPINKIATGCESVGAEAAKVRKLIINGKVYIIRGGQVFDVLGKTIKK